MKIKKPKKKTAKRDNKKAKKKARSHACSACVATRWEWKPLSLHVYREKHGDAQGKRLPRKVRKWSVTTRDPEVGAIL